MKFVSFPHALPSHREMAKIDRNTPIVSVIYLTRVIHRARLRLPHLDSNQEPFDLQPRFNLDPASCRDFPTVSTIYGLSQITRHL